MNRNLKRGFAVVFTAALLCNSLGSTQLFSNLTNDISVTYASSEYTSGASDRYFYTEDKEFGVKLYYSVIDYKAKTAAVIGCTTCKENVPATVPNTVTYQNVTYDVVKIESNAFRDQKNLGSVSLPKNLVSIESFAFAGCSNLYYLCGSSYTGDGRYKLNKIGSYAFMDCEKMITPAFLAGVTVIGDYTFYNCRSLYDRVHLAKISSLGKYAFANCVLTEVDFSESQINGIPDNTFQYCCAYDKEITFKLPDTVKSIGKYAFNNISGLTGIYIPSVEKIDDYAFKDCHDLKTVLTSEKLSYIGRQAFYGCDPLKYFVCKNPDVSISAQALGYCNMRNYTGKCNGFKLWSTNGGGKVKSYAKYYGFEYDDMKNAPAQAIESFKPYMWSCGNETKVFGEYQNGKLVRNHMFIEGHKPYVTESYLNSSSTGTCYGMASVSTLAANKYIYPEEFADGYSSICEIDSSCSDFTKSFVSTMWTNCRYTADYQFSHNGSTANFDKEMISFIENLTYGTDVATVSYSEYSNGGGHAVVCLGLEYKENAADKNTNKQWDGMNARILLYDVNYDKFENLSCMYINTETGEWSMGVRYGIGTVNPSAFNTKKSPSFRFELYYKPDSIVSNTKTPEGTLKGMDFVRKLLSIRK